MLIDKAIWQYESAMEEYYFEQYLEDYGTVMEGKILSVNENNDVFRYLVEDKGRNVVGIVSVQLLGEINETPEFTTRLDRSDFD